MAGLYTASISQCEESSGIVSIDHPIDTIIIGCLAVFLLVGLCCVGTLALKCVFALLRAEGGFG